MTGPVAQKGVENLINHCVAVEKGEAVLLLNGYGDVEPSLVDLMEDATRAAGGHPYSLWIDPVMPGGLILPSVVANAILASDKLVLNTNLNRVALLDHLRGNGHANLVRINNRTRTANAIASEHARFDWRLVMALARRLQEVTSQAREWRITTPHGTDIRGSVARGSEVADAFFVQDAELSRTERVFPGEVYAPVGAANADGTIAFDHPGLADKDLFQTPMLLTVENNVLVDVAWREEAPRQERGESGVQTVWTRDQFLRLLQANEDKYGHDKTYTIDSWHGGMHPKAVKRAGALSDTKTMHFHVGRVQNTLSAYISDHTVLVDGTPLFENGEIVLFREPDIQAMATEYGVTL